MKQNINLYDARFLKRRDWLSGRSVGLMMLFALLAVVVGTIYARWALAEEEAHAQAVASQLLEARTSFADLTRSLTARKPDDKLVEQVELMQRELDLARQTKALLANMSDRGGSLMVGEMMRVLTRVGADGLWLTGLAGWTRGERGIVRGAAATAFLLFGMALLYAQAGSLSTTALAALSTAPGPSSAMTSATASMRFVQ